MDLTEAEYDEALIEFAAIEELVEKNVVGARSDKGSGYWCWPVLNSDLLPGWVRPNYLCYGEIRWYYEA